MKKNLIIIFVFIIYQLLTPFIQVCTAKTPFNVSDKSASFNNYKIKNKKFQITTLNHQDSIKKNTVFEAGTEGYAVYRIPAIIKIPNGDLLAFCEARASYSDNGNIDIVMKRSKDNGQSWGKLQIIVDFKKLRSCDGSIYGDLYGDHTAGNPAPVVDLMDKNFENGRIFLAFNTDITGERSILKGIGVREVWVMNSVDNGITWSDSQNITASVSKPNEPDFDQKYNFEEDWRWHAITPGHAIQLKHSAYAGRILFASNHTSGNSKYISHTFYTDNHGESWHLGNDVGENTNECMAAEFENGEIMINCRNYDGNKQRAVATSNDGGISWDNIYRDPQLPDPICQGSILYNSTKKHLYFTNPNDAKSRSNLTIRISTDKGKTWKFNRTIEKEDGAYSDMVLQNNGNIGVLYETSSYTKINFISVTDKWIKTK